IVLDFIKRALSLQQVPPTSVLNGIAFFMTLFVMWPTFSNVYEKAYKPLSSGQITIEEAYKEAETPIRMFMYSHCTSTVLIISIMIAFIALMRLKSAPLSLFKAIARPVLPCALISSLTASARVRSILPCRNALNVNSPGRACLNPRFAISSRTDLIT
ncbi:MAG: hypothetical protein IIU44_00220, partial [Spirochaetales bacterium]|nr:hypothetical protein [Spirochaetales bacterium]